MSDSKRWREAGIVATTLCKRGIDNGALLSRVVRRREQQHNRAVAKER